MGIQGLIPFLDKASSRINISQYKDCCVAVDAYCWLHKGAYTCAEKLAKGEKCDAYVFYCMKYVNMLISHNIKPILVFDGRHLPAKAGTEKKRRESREVNRKTAEELMKAGRMDEAHKFLRRCVDVTHAMAHTLIRECRKINVDCIVAPYEADAQLAYLNLQNIAQLVITEDSDLILFGCKKVVFKLDLSGTGLLVEQKRLHLSMGVREENFNFDSFRYMCILSGCDYLPSLPGIGLNKALKFINKTRDPDIHRALRRLPSYLNMTQLQVSEEYRNSFLHADSTFRYQPVYDSRSRSLVPLTKPPEGEELPDIVKEQLPPSVVLDLALGNLDPLTLTRVDNFHPDCPHQGLPALQKRSWGPSITSAHPSIWSRDFPGFQPHKNVKNQYPSTLDQSAILDITPLRTSKRPAATADEERKDAAFPTQDELLSMYGNVQSTEQEPKRMCTSATVFTTNGPSMVTTSSPENNTEPGITLLYNEQQTPPSPILSQCTSRNPFAKPKQALPTGRGPPSAISCPNYFSALRKFDGIYPMQMDSDITVISRYFRSCSVAESQPPTSDDVLRDVSNTSPHSPSQDALLEEAMLEGYTCDKENKKETRDGQLISVLAAIEATQNNVTALCQSTQSGISSNVELKNNNSDDGMEKMIANNELEEETTSVKNPAPSFDWSQFSYRKSETVAKLSSSQAVSGTFKNPFRKKVSSKISVSVNGSKNELGGAGDMDSICRASSEYMTAEIDLTADDHVSVPNTLLSVVDRSSEDIFKSSQEELEPSIQLGDESSFILSGPCGDVMKDQSAVEKDLCPSRNNICEQLSTEEERQEVQDEEAVLSGVSCDSGFQGSQEMPLKTGTKSTARKESTSSLYPTTRGQSTPTLRRIGLGRSSTLPKQNLLAQYGFSKKRKLAH